MQPSDKAMTREAPIDTEVLELRAEIEGLRDANTRMATGCEAMGDEIARLKREHPYSEVDMDMHVEAVTKDLRAEIARLQRENDALRKSIHKGGMNAAPLAEVERLTAAVLRIDGINDNPADFNGEINAVCDTILRPALKDTKP